MKWVLQLFVAACCAATATCFTTGPFLSSRGSVAQGSVRANPAAELQAQSARSAPFRRQQTGGYGGSWTSSVCAGVVLGLCAAMRSVSVAMYADKRKNKTIFEKTPTGGFVNQCTLVIRRTKNNTHLTLAKDGSGFKQKVYSLSEKRMVPALYKAKQFRQTSEYAMEAMVFAMKSLGVEQLDIIVYDALLNRRLLRKIAASDIQVNKVSIRNQVPFGGCRPPVLRRI
mmetsp:Transcript_13115/g.24154  ORF Transcript_13115/g.24154 Transcript_13115/m.24154 type:complete len:227 (+) Transcript_13115:53-733(+)